MRKCFLSCVMSDYNWTRVPQHRRRVPARPAGLQGRRRHDAARLQPEERLRAEQVGGGAAGAEGQGQGTARHRVQVVCSDLYARGLLGRERKIYTGWT